MDTNLQKYMAFLAAAETGNFTRASEQLNYSQSGISRMISDLEREWGITLFERNKTRSILTPDGRQIHPHVKSLIGAFDSLQAHVKEIRGLESGTIRIGSFMSAASQWIPNLIKAFQKDYPGIEFEIREGDYDVVCQMIREGTVDMSFTLADMAEELPYEMVERDRYVAILPMDHPLRGEERFPLSALGGDPFLMVESDEETHIRDLLKQYGITPDVRYRSLDDYFIMSMVENGLGISILPGLMVRRGGYRILVKELDRDMHRDIVLAYKDKALLPEAGRRFLEYLDFRQGAKGDGSPFGSGRTVPF